MADIDVSEGFIEDMLKVHLDSKRVEIWNAISLLEDMPEMGSHILPLSISCRFGEEARKIVVDPFDLIYRYFPEQDVVYIAGLVHQRAAW